MPDIWTVLAESTAVRLGSASMNLSIYVLPIHIQQPQATAHAGAIDTQHDTHRSVEMSSEHPEHAALISTISTTGQSCCTSTRSRIIC